MLKIWIFFIIIFLFFTSIFSIEFYFNSSSTGLTSESRDDLSSFKQEFELFFKKNPKTLIFLTGHTDNTESPEGAKTLSLARANLIREYLVDKLKIDTQYILIYGRGPFKPVDSNDTATGRSRNRRVELVFDQPVAHFGLLHGKVEYIPSLTSKVLKPKENTYIFRDDQIKTGKSSKATIGFRNKNQLTMEENSSLVVYGDFSSNFTNLLDDTFHLKLNYGKLDNNLINIQNRSINIKTSAANLQLFSPSHRVEHKNGNTLIYLFKGYGIITAQDRARQIEEGYGIRIAEGSQPEKPVILPEKPEEIQISDTDPLLQGRRVKLTWIGSYSKYFVQVALDNNFNQINSEMYVDTSEIQLELSYGKYFVRIKSITDSGLKSSFSETFSLNILETEFVTCRDLKENIVYHASKPDFRLEGTTVDKLKIYLNGQELAVSPDLTFSRQLNLDYGSNEIYLRAVLPDGNEEIYHYTISFSPPVDKLVKFYNIRSDIVNNSLKKKFHIQAEASEFTRLFISDEEIFRLENGLFEHIVSLENGINELIVTVKFIDGTEEVHRFEILYNKKTSGFSIREFAIVLGILAITATPFIVNALLY